MADFKLKDENQTTHKCERCGEMSTRKFGDFWEYDDVTHLCTKCFNHMHNKTKDFLEYTGFDKHHLQNILIDWPHE